jgi:hypothetical protein
VAASELPSYEDTQCADTHMWRTRWTLFLLEIRIIAGDLALTRLHCKNYWHDMNIYTWIGDWGERCFSWTQSGIEIGFGFVSCSCLGYVIFTRLHPCSNKCDFVRIFDVVYCSCVVVDWIDRPSLRLYAWFLGARCLWPQAWCLRLDAWFLDAWCLVKSDTLRRNPLFGWSIDCVIDWLAIRGDWIISLPFQQQPSSLQTPCHTTCRRIGIVCVSSWNYCLSAC